MTYFEQQTEGEALLGMRICSICGKPMMNGYMIEDGSMYYCSDKCLYTDGYTKEQYEEDYENGFIFWTEWE